MKCDFNLLEDYVEGFLKEIEQKKVEAHLQSCKKCQNEYKQLLNEQNYLFAQLNKPSMVNSQANAIMQRIQANTKRKKSWQTVQTGKLVARQAQLKKELETQLKHSNNSVATQE